MILLKEKELNIMNSENYEIFKSNICHALKHEGDLSFLLSILKSNQIEKYYKEKKYLECYYLLGMIDYLCRINNLPFDNKYNYIREYKIENPVFSAGIQILCYIEGNDEPKQRSLNEAIPEFLRYNIVEGEIRDVA
jgi:hypothetical protein